MAIVNKKGDLVLQQIKTGDEHEIVAAIGRRIGQRRKIIIVNTYIPPSLDADSSDKVLQKVVDLIRNYKRKYESPYILLGGDFNKRNIQKELKTHGDIKLVLTPPTRGNNTLDLLFTNFPQ